MRFKGGTISFLSTFVYFAFYALINVANCNEEDAWDTAKQLREQLPIPEDLRRRNVFEFDPFGDTVEDGISIVIPMDYFESERERAYKWFWDNSATDVQKEYYKLLQEETIQGSHQSDAHWELKEMALYGKYGFPHNKTLAYYHLEKFNELTKRTNSTALFELSVMYSTGLFGTIERDVPKALILLHESANLGNMRAKQALANRLFHGLDLEQDMVKSRLIYAEIADFLRSKYTFEEWNIRPPYIESYNLRIPDLGEGLIGKRNSLFSYSSAKRLRQRKPKSVESFLPSDQNVLLQLGNELTLNNLDAADDFEADRISDIFYAALNSYHGTYTLVRDPETAASILQMAYSKHKDQVSTMEVLSRAYFAKCVELLGHQYMRGEGVELDIELAEKYLTESLRISKNLGSTIANTDLGLIAQYYKNDKEKAWNFYNNTPSSEGMLARFQMSKLAANEKHTITQVSCQILYLQHICFEYFPAAYELARLTEQNSTRFNSNDNTNFYRYFVNENEQHLAYYLKDAFLALLRQESEVALWYYAMAAEQGYHEAQVSAAWLLYQPPRLFEKPPIIPEARRDMALHYYLLSSLGQRGIRGQYSDAKVVAGDIFYNMGEYEKAVKEYETCNNVQCLWNLGYMYEYGLGVEKDFHLAKRFYEQASGREESIENYLPILKLQLHWALSWISENIVHFDVSTFNNWLPKKWDKWTSTGRVTPDGKKVKKPTQETRFFEAKSWYRSAMRYIKSIPIEMNEEVLMITITLAVILISFVVSFLRGNVNIRFNGFQIGGNNNEGVGDDAQPPAEGEVNIMFFAI